MCHDALLAGLTRPEIDREALIYAKGKKVDGTCEWIMRNSEYQSWLRGDMELLWICGGPGKGKTMMSIFLTQELEKQNHTIYFFCQADSEKRRTAPYVLRSLLWQLVAKQPKLSDHLLKDFGTAQKAQTALLSLETLWATLTAIVCDSRLDATVYLLVDGLDECDEESQRWLAAKLLILNKVSTTDTRKSLIRTVIVSRNTIVSLRKCKHVKLDPDHNTHISADIETFVSCKVQELFDLHKFDMKFQSRIRSMLSEKAEGTFLWIGFAMIELLQKQTMTEIEMTIRAMPKGLPALYDRMLLRIPPDHRRISSTILRWVTLAVSPLTLAELGAAVGILPHVGLQTEHAVHDQLTICGPIFRVVKGEVRLVHESVRDHLLKLDSVESTVLRSFYTLPCEGHLELARRCVAHVVELDMPGQRSTPLMKYPLAHWPEHARNALNLGQQLVDEFVSFFAPQSSTMDSWWQQNPQDKPPRPDWVFFKYHGLMGHLTSLHIACYIGFLPWAQTLLSLERTWTWRLRKSFGRVNEYSPTPLYMAVLGDWVHVANMLLERNADIDHQLHKCTALFSAIEHRNEPMVRVLLDHKADANIRCRNGYTALFVAVQSGNHVVTRMLLRAGANLDIMTDDGSTPLHCAVEKGDQVITQLLIDFGAYLEAKDSNEKTPLHYAAGKGDQAIAQLLLERGSSMTAVDNRGWFPIHYAAISPNEALVPMLIQHGEQRAMRKVGNF